MRRRPPSSPASLLPVNIHLLSAFLACAIAQFLKLFTTCSSDESQMKSNVRDGEAAGYLDNVCKEVECGKGNCKPSRNSSFLFDCECEPGWKQVRSDHDGGLGFLPCVIPNCTMDLSCMKAPTPAPVQNKQKRTNESFFDPCRWAECGGGTCNKTSPFTYACQCEANYYNLLNVTALPCFRECALGAECSDLGISVLNRSSSSQTPSLSNNDSNQACLVKGGVFNWLAFMVILLALVIEK